MALTAAPKLAISLDACAYNYDANRDVYDPIWSQVKLKAREDRGIQDLIISEKMRANLFGDTLLFGSAIRPSTYTHPVRRRKQLLLTT